MRALAAILLAAAAPGHAAVSVFTSDFESDWVSSTGPFPFELLDMTPNATIVSSGDVPQSGSQLLRNEGAAATTWSVTRLGAHSSLTLGFDITFIDSWDGGGQTSQFSPDWLFVNIGGLAPMQWTASHDGSGTTVISPSCSLLSGGSNTIGSSWNDSTYRCAFTFAHTAADWSLSINAGGAGFQYGSDESWGIDNVSLAAEPASVVPEPATWALMIIGFGAVGAAVRRRSTERLA